MSLSDVQTAFNEIQEKYHREFIRVCKATKIRLYAAQTVDEVKVIEQLAEQCYGHITSSMDEAAYWMKRLADNLERES